MASDNQTAADEVLCPYCGEMIKAVARKCEGHDDAQAAINGMNQKNLKGSALNVDEARSQTDRPGGAAGNQ